MGPGEVSARRLDLVRDEALGADRRHVAQRVACVETQVVVERPHPVGPRHGEVAGDALGVRAPLGGDAGTGQSRITRSSAST